jgi:hypothetical protein
MGASCVRGVVALGAVLATTGWLARPALPPPVSPPPPPAMVVYGGSLTVESTPYDAAALATRPPGWADRDPPHPGALGERHEHLCRTQHGNPGGADPLGRGADGAQVSQLGLDERLSRVLLK